MNNPALRIEHPRYQTGPKQTIRSTGGFYTDTKCFKECVRKYAGSVKVAYLPCQNRCKMGLN